MMRDANMAEDETKFGTVPYFTMDICHDRILEYQKPDKRHLAVRHDY